MFTLTGLYSFSTNKEAVYDLPYYQTVLHMPLKIILLSPSAQNLLQQLQIELSRYSMVVSKILQIEVHLSGTVGWARFGFSSRHGTELCTQCRVCLGLSLCLIPSKMHE